MITGNLNINVGSIFKEKYNDRNYRRALDEARFWDDPPKAAKKKKRLTMKEVQASSLKKAISYFSASLNSAFPTDHQTYLIGATAAYKPLGPSYTFFIRVKTDRFISKPLIVRGVKEAETFINDEFSKRFLQWLSHLEIEKVL